MAPTTVTFTLTRRDAGRSVDGRCVKPTMRDEERRRCTRTSRQLAHVTRSALAGINHLVLSTRIAGHTLGPGTYQLAATPSHATSSEITFTLRG